jgi:hypothetical protein
MKYWVVFRQGTEELKLSRFPIFKFLKRYFALEVAAKKIEQHLFHRCALEGGCCHGLTAACWRSDA